MAKLKAASLQALMSPIEALEQRLLLSVDVSAEALETPLFTVGSRWTYDYTVNHSTGTVVRTVIGYTTLSNDLEKWEIDETSPGVSGVEKNFYGLDAEGDFVTYGDSANASGYTSNDTYSPPLINLLAEMAQGIGYSFSAADTSSLTNPSGVTTTSTSLKTTTVTLASATPSDWTVTYGTYSAYQVTTVNNGTGNSTVEYDSPEYGLLELDTMGVIISTLVLTNFETNHDNLSFTNIPTTVVPPGTPISPPITVELRDNTGVLDTNATGTTAMLTLNSASRLGTSPGILGGTTTATFVAGVATFSNLTVSAAGSYTLTASDSAGDAQFKSDPFSVGGLQLTLTPIGVNPKGVKIGDVIRFTLLVSPKKAIETQQLVVTLPTGFTASGVTQGGTPPNGNTITWTASTVRLVDFQIKVPNASVISSLSNILVSAVDNVTYSDGTTDQGTASRTIPLKGDTFRFTTQPPSSTGAGSPFAVAVQLLNSAGAVDTTADGSQIQLSLQIISGDQSATLGGTTIATVADGMATFPASAGPSINAVGTFKVVATQVGMLNPATIASRQVKVTGYRLKLVSKLGPFVAENPDVADSTSINAYFGIFDSNGKPALFTSSLPDAQITAQTISGDGSYTGDAQATATAGYPDNNARQDITLTTYTTQANYRFSLMFSAPGTYKLTISEADGGTDTTPVLAPVDVICNVTNPVLAVHYTEGAANATEHYEVTIDRTPQRSAIDFFNNLSPVSSVGVHVDLISSTSGGNLSGTTDMVFTTNAVQSADNSGVQITDYYSAAEFSFQFDTPGLYTLQFTETMSGGDVPFNAATAAAVATTAPITIVARVLPDKVAFFDQPPKTVAAGQTFSASVALESSDGAVLTDQGTDSGATQLYATVTATSSQDPTPFVVIDPVPFAIGMATLSNLTLPAKGVYRLHVVVKELHNGSYFGFPDELTASSIYIHVTGT